ncbi:hypothetical protein [Glycomyces sp. YM15]|uniref:hypothetical protein n=1 Tax=Glycomyces sp. YM15 TaxID=2800446 RepID=UPI0019636901|nr:hypothetical protein [Glycomyces sp. YM15]
MLERQWLEPGEKTLDWISQWKLPAFDGIPKPPWTAEQVWRRIGKVVGLTLAWIAGSVVLLIVLAFLAEGLSGASVDGGSGKKLKGPNVVLRGQGRDSVMGRMVTPALRCRGLWVYTNRRIAFIAVEGRTYGKFLSGSGQPSEFTEPVPIRTLFQVREPHYRYDGEADRLRRTRFLRRFKPAGVYRRISFADGSGVDLRRYRK